MSSSIAHYRATMQRARTRSAMEIAKRENTLVSVTASAILGVAEAKGHKLPAVCGVDGTVVFGAIALVAAPTVGGQMGRILQSLADGWLAIGAYKMGRAVGGAAISGTDASAMDALLSAS